jgi:molybdopterin biosynthesis enzyme
LICARGARITPARAALLAWVGLERVRVIERLSAQVLAIGNELGELRPEVTGRLLADLLEEFGVQATVAGVIGDSPEEIRGARDRLLAGGLVVACGGTGGGLSDRTLHALRTMDLRILGEGLNVFPGESTALSIRGEGVCVCVPGDPEAAFAATHFLLRPALARWLGCPLPAWSTRPRVPLAEPWSGPVALYVMAPAIPTGRTVTVADRRGAGGLLGAAARVVLLPGAATRTEGVMVGP